jgi:2-dehydropantoate 2-reductase
MEQLDGFMQGAMFDARLTRAIEYEMWEKWVLLATIGGITCLMRGNIGEVVAAPGGAPFILSFLDEVVSVVGAVGQAPKTAFVEGARKTLTTPGSTQAPSMFRDLQQGSPIEADQIIGDLLARGAKAGIATPLLATAYAHMSLYQRRLARP